MGGKSGGGARTPTIERNTLHSAQKLKFIDLISSGEIFGFKHGNDQPLKSILLNGTPIQNQDDSLNFNGVRVEYNRGTNDQDYLPSFSTIDRAVPVGAQVKKNTPITRTVSNSEVTSIRVTAGVDALMRTTKEGDQLKTEVSMTIMLMKNNVIHSSKLMTLNEKGSKPFRLDFEFDDLPEVPFEVRCVRNTADSNDDMLRNNTYFFSYVESIDAKMSYPLSAVAAMEIDSEQFGNDNPERTYDLKGAIVQVPSNYDPETRTYSGLWDRLFKPAWTNNPVWILYDLLTDEIDGFNAFNKGIKIDIDSFYNTAKYCDELIDDGAGGKEPRFVCNAVFYGEDAYTAINNICSSFRAVCGYNGEYLTLYTDRAHDVAKIYNNSMVVDGLFEYSETELSQRYNQVQVQYVDENNGYETTIDEVSDDANIALVERILTLSIVAFGATKLSHARRAALWALITSLTEKVLVSFKVGASGIYHEIYDIIEIVDNDYIGTMAGGRIKAVNGNIITLDREVNDVVKFSIETKKGPQNFDVKRQISETEYELILAPEIIESAPFNAILKDVEPRLFRCTNIEENDDGTYTVSAIQHNPQKEAIVDNGAQYMPEGNTTIINSVPGLSNGIANNDGKAIILEWDSLSVIGTENKYRIQLFRDKAIYQTFEAKETFLRLENLPQGEYIAKIRAVNSNGQYSEEITIAFSTTYKIDGLRAKPIVFGIELNWQLPALITSDVFTEVWYSEQDDRMTATKLATVVYPQNNYLMNGLSVSDKFCFWFRLVDVAGNQGEFTHSILGKPSDNSDDILSYLDGKISDKQISKDLQDQFDKNIDDKIKESEIVINDSIGKLELDNEKLNINVEKLSVDDILASISSTNEGYTRKSQDNKLEVNVADAFAQIEETNTVIVDKTNALAQKDTQLEASIGENKAEINQIKVTQVDDQKSIAILKDEVKTQFDKNEADAILSIISLATESETRSQQNLKLSANLGSALSEIEETKTAIAKDKLAQAEIDQRIESKVDNNSAQIRSISQTQTTDKESLTQQINSAKSEIGENKAEIEQVKNTVVNNEKAQSLFKEDVKTKFNENEADAVLSLISQSTEGYTRSQQDSMLSANVADAHAEIEETKGVIAEEKKSQAEINTTLTSKVDSNTVQIKANAQTQATDKAALTQQIESANSKIGANTASIEGLKETQVDDKKSLSNQITKMESEWKKSTEIRYLTGTVEPKTPKDYAQLYGKTTVKEFGVGGWFNMNVSTFHTVTTEIAYLSGLQNGRVVQTAIENIGGGAPAKIKERRSVSDTAWSKWTDIENIEGSQAKADKARDEAIKTSKASIDSLSKTQASDIKSLTEQINNAKSEIDGHTASITHISSTQAKTDGKVNALWTLKVDANGAIGGIMLGSDGKESQFKVAADTFVVSTPDQSVNIFSLQQVGGKTIAALNGDLIAKGSISGDKIVANTSIQAPKIKGGSIEAGFVKGGHIDIGNGNFRVNEMGELFAKSGSFEGTIYAEKIEGDIADIYTLRTETGKTRSIRIPAAKFKRRLIFVGTSISGGSTSASGPHYSGRAGKANISINDSPGTTYSAQMYAVARMYTEGSGDNSYTAVGGKYIITPTPLNFFYDISENEETVVKVRLYDGGVIVGDVIHVMVSKLSN